MHRTHHENISETEKKYISEKFKRRLERNIKEEDKIDEDIDKVTSSNTEFDKNITVIKLLKVQKPDNLTTFSRSKLTTSELVF